MVQGGGGAGFLLETAQAVRVRGEVRGEDLDGYIAPQPGIVGAIDFPHSARTDFRTNFVRAQRAGDG